MGDEQGRQCGHSEPCLCSMIGDTEVQTVASREIRTWVSRKEALYAVQQTLQHRLQIVAQLITKGGKPVRG